MAAFAQFASDLDAATRAQLERGERLTELLKQGQYVPMSVEEQIISIYAGTNGYVDALPVSSVREYEAGLLKYFKQKHAAVLEEIREKRDVDPELKKKIDKALKRFAKKFAPGEG